MELGFAVTRHCNLRCPHCIRDDVASFHELAPEFLAHVLDQARVLFGEVVVGLTGGEPLVHRRFGEVIEVLGERGIRWRMVSNGWHLARALPILERHRPEYIRLSLSGGNAETHDAERGRGSFGRVLLGIGLLASRGIPAGLTMVVDRRDRHELGTAADLAEGLGAAFIQFILPQPVPASAARNTDLAPEEWRAVVEEVHGLASRPNRATTVYLAYGAPPLFGPELLCRTKQLGRLTIDVEGRLSLCCQLSEYGSNAKDVVADLHRVPLADAWAEYRKRMAGLRRRTDPAASGPGPGLNGDLLAEFPCMRCARTLGKLEWLAANPSSPWAAAARGPRSRGVLPVLAEAHAG